MAFINRVKFDGLGKRESGEELPWLVYKFPSENIVLGAQLIVHESQEALFLKGGKVFDVFGPGRFTLESGNIPLLRRFINLPFGGKTPFPAEVYFVNKTSKLDMKWGTSDRVQIQDPNFGIIIDIGAFGQFGLKVSDSKKIVEKIIGALQENMTSDYEKISNYFKSLVVTNVKDLIANTIVKKKQSIFEIMASLNSISEACKNKISLELDKYGIKLINFFVESINIPQENTQIIRENLEKKASVEQIGKDDYKTIKILDALDKAASNEGPGGVGASIGVGLGAGLFSGKVFAEMLGNLNKNASGNKNIETINCPKCNNTNPVNAKFCSNCGESLEKKVCSNCKPF